MKTATAASRHFYAISHHYGANMCHANTGNRIGTYYVFATKTARDAWVADGPDYVQDSGAREAINANDSEIRALRRQLEVEGGHPAETLTLRQLLDRTGNSVVVTDYLDGYEAGQAERERIAAWESELAEQRTRWND